MDHFLFKEQVIQRYRIEPDVISNGVDPQSSKRFQQDFINLLVRAFEEEKNFSFRQFRAFPISVILDYIRRTHLLYINKLLQEIEQSIEILNGAYENGHPLLIVLNNFYLNYKSDLVLHIREEDEQLLPYIESLVSCMNSGFEQHRFYGMINKFSISKFLESHSDNDNILQEVRSKILEYEPPVTNLFTYRVLLNQLEFFAHDLKIHGLIEDKVLLPCAFEMEQKMMREFLEIVRVS